MFVEYIMLDQTRPCIVEPGKVVVAKNGAPVKDEPIYGATLLREYATFCTKQGKKTSGGRE